MTEDKSNNVGVLGALFFAVAIAIMTALTVWVYAYDIEGAKCDEFLLAPTNRVADVNFSLSIYDSMSKSNGFENQLQLTQIATDARNAKNFQSLATVPGIDEVFEISSMPTFKIFRGRDVIDTAAGTKIDVIKEFIEKNL